MRTHEVGNTFPIWQELVERVKYGEGKKEIDRTRVCRMTSLLEYLMYGFQQKYKIPNSTMYAISENALLARYPVTTPVCAEFYHSKVKEGDWNACKVLICLIIYARESNEAKGATDKDWEEWIDQM